MQQGILYVSEDAVPTSHLPLESVIHYLKTNGFSIKPDDYVEILKVVERFQPATLREAGSLICPLICTNETDQEKFYVVFEKLCSEEPAPAPLPILPWWKKIFQRKNRKFLWLGFPVILLISWLTNIPPIYYRSHPCCQAIIQVASSTSKTPVYQPGDSIVLTALGSFGNPCPGAGQNSCKAGDTATTTVEWNLGKGWEKGNNKELLLTPDQPGPIVVMLRLVSAEERVSLDTQTIQVYDKLPDIRVASNYSQTVPVDSLVKLRAVVSPGNHENAASAWVINGDTVKVNSDTIQRSFSEQGPYSISYVFFPEAGNHAYYNLATLALEADNKATRKITLQPEYLGSRISSPMEIKTVVFGILIFLFISTLIASWLLLLAKKRKEGRLKKTASEIPGQPSVLPADKKPIFDLPLENRQEQLIVPEPAVNEVMRFMHQRTLDEALALNIGRTVQNTIRSGGIPDLVYSNKLRYNDYLVLIDASIGNSQQLKLFEYLVRTFKNENISIVRFFYQDGFSTFYNEEYPAGLPFRRLSELYKHFTLIIYGPAYHLLYEAYPVIDPEKMLGLSEWASKGILTPVPYKDWSIKERVIAREMILLPADAEGQLRFIKAINENLFRHDDFLSSAKNFYRTSRYDFNEPDQISNYLNDEDLFQWLCATALYPKVRWELLIELGKVVLQARGCPEKMNYTSLLKLVRISWLHEGYFPEDTRLELMKLLGQKEELAARKKLVELFEYADYYFKDNYYFSREKKMQEITNKFILYAADPVNNESYSSFKEQFEALWKQNKIADAPLKEYIDNKDEKWDTPLKKDQQTVGAEGFFEKKSGTGKISNLEKMVRITSAAAALSLMLLITTFLAEKNIAPSRIANSLGLAILDSNSQVTIQAQTEPLGTCLLNERDTSTIRKVSYQVDDGSGNIFYPSGSDSLSASFRIPYRSLASNTLSLQMTWETEADYGGNTSPGSGINSESIMLNDNSDMIRFRLSGCPDDSVYSIIVKYNDPSAQNEAIRFIQELDSRGFKNVTMSNEAISDSMTVRYNNPRDSALAREISSVAGTFFNKPYQSIRSGNDTASASLVEVFVFTPINVPVECTSVPGSRLSASLSEIWKGRTNNRLIHVDLSRNLVYYSTGNANNYGTYSIARICQSGDIYRFILRGGAVYRTALVRNIRSNSFELSFCQQEFSSQADAENLTQANCNVYDQMEPYYVQDTAKIFFPLRPENSNLAIQERAKLTGIAETLRRSYTNQSSTVTIQKFEYNQLRGGTGQTRAAMNILDNLAGKQSYQTPATQSLRGTPFDRNYAVVRITSGIPTCNKIYRSEDELLKLAGVEKICRVNLSRQGLKTVPEILYKLPDLTEVDISYNSIPQAEIDRFQKAMPRGCKLIANGQQSEIQQQQVEQNNAPQSTSGPAFPDQIEFAGDATTVDSKTAALLREIGQVLQGNSRASVTFTAGYSSDLELKIAEARLSSIRNAIEREAKFRSAQVQTVTRRTNLANQQQQRPLTRNYVEVVYQNFPTTAGDAKRY